MNPGIRSTSSCIRRDVLRYASESAPSRRWVLKMTTTSVGSLTRRYGNCLHSRPFRGRYRSEARGHVLCGGPSTSVLRAVDEFQARPHFIDGTDLPLDEAVGQGQRAQDVLGQGGRDSGRLLRPRDPEASLRRESFFPRQEPAFQVRASPNERVHYVDAAVRPIEHPDTLITPTDETRALARRPEPDAGEVRL